MPAFALFINPRRGTPGTVTLPAAGFRRAKAEITSWDGYAPTPLRDLPLSGTVRFKDEADRFGLGSFKALGATYAAVNLLAAALARQNIAPSARSADLSSGRYAEATQRITLTAATDGNHGRAVAWAASRFHCRCVIYLHETVSKGREAAIDGFGAEVRRVPGTYDDSVRACAQDAGAAGWCIVSDTSWPGYTEVPRDIMQGYRMMADEAADQWNGPPPTHVFIQGGVGGAAAAVSVQVRTRWGKGESLGPAIVVVEPEHAACLLASARAGRITPVTGELDTIVACLACGEPSLLAWQELERSAAAFMAIPDTAAIDTMRFLAALGVVSGESGVAGLAALRLAMADPEASAALGLSLNSRVLVFGTEGATDTLVYESLIHGYTRLMRLAGTRFAYTLPNCLQSGVRQGPVLNKEPEMRNKWPVVVTCVALCAVYFSYPYATLYRLDVALRHSDSATLQSLVDWYTVREGLKEDICDMVFEEPSNARPNTDLAPFGAGFVRGMTGNALDHTVTPETLVSMVSAGGKAAPVAAAAHARVAWAFFENPTQFVVELRSDGVAEPIRMVMELRGLSWKVRRVWLPNALLERAGSGT